MLEPVLKQMKSTCVITRVFQFAVNENHVGYNCAGNRVRVLEKKKNKKNRKEKRHLMKCFKEVPILLDLSADNLQIHTGFIMSPIL